MWSMQTAPNLAIVSLFSIVILANKAEAGSGLPCEVIWVASGYNAFEKHTIQAGIKNTVARISNAANPPEFYGGFLNQIDWIAYAVDYAENIVESETYAVLTNPLNCSLEWILVDSETDSIPDHAVTINSCLTPATCSYIGRAPFDGTFRSGYIPSGNSFLFAADEDTVLKFRHYEVLTSQQPFLHVSLTKFGFELDLKAIEANSKRELFAVDHVTGAGGAQIQFKVENEADIDEYFELKENVAESWVGVGSIDLNLILWCGSPPLKLVDVERGEDNSLTVTARRERVVKVSATYTLTSAEKSAVCSFAIMHEDLEIPFTAKAKFKSAPGQNKIGQSEIRKILLETGRNETTFEDLPDGSIQATITGTLNGRFMLRTHLFTEDNDPAYIEYGPCDRHLIPPP